MVVAITPDALLFLNESVITNPAAMSMKMKIMPEPLSGSICQSVYLAKDDDGHRNNIAIGIFVMILFRMSFGLFRQKQFNLYQY